MMTPKNCKKMLNTANDVALKYHIEFGVTKCKLLKVGPGRAPTIKTGNTELENVNSYKYLGVLFNTRNNLKDHIEALASKIRAATLKIMAETRDKNFKGMKMRAIWEYANATLVPILTYGLPAWEPSKPETEKMQTILNRAIKTILYLPQSTPTLILLAETGTTPIDLTLKKRKLMQENQLKNTIKKGLVHKVIEGELIWKSKIDKIKSEFELSDTELEGENKLCQEPSIEKSERKWSPTSQQRLKINQKPNAGLRKKKQEIPLRSPGYMNKLNRKQCNTVIRTRSRMLKIKANQNK